MPRAERASQASVQRLVARRDGAGRQRPAGARWLSAWLVPLLALLACALVAPSAAQQGSAADPPAAAPRQAPATSYGRVGYLHVHGPIDGLRERYLRRALADAPAAGLDTVVVHIDTDGGAVINARDMFKLVLDQRREDLHTVAFVDYRAISAGAMLAYAHQELYIAETATIGDIGVVFRSAEGTIEYAPEKIETVIRALLVQAAEQNGWSRGLLLKMTAHKQKLYRVQLADGSARFVIEDDLPAFLHAHPDIDADDSRQVLVYRGEDRLLTLTGREAVELGMATANMADLDALYRHLGVEAGAVVDLSPRTSELAAWQLATFAPLLAGLALLFVMFELKTPGVGIWAGLGALAGAAFLFAQYYLDMVENFEVVLLLLGLALVAAEVMTLISGGLLAVIGAALAFGGLVLMFLPNESSFDFTDPAFVNALFDAGLSALMALGVVASGVIAAIYLLPRSGLPRNIAVATEVTATSASARSRAAQALVGSHGIARDALHPGGTVTIDGEDHGARAEHGSYVAAGSEVVVLAVEFGELLVRAVPADGDAAGAAHAPGPAHGPGHAHG